MDAGSFPDLTLWRAVISNAFTDACCENKGFHRERDNARYWLLRDTYDFPLVCQYALLDPDQVRTLARTTLEAHMRMIGQLEDEPEFNQC